MQTQYCQWKALFALDRCVWDAKYEEKPVCEVSGPWEAKLIASADPLGEDSLCQYSEALGDSQCLDVEEPDDCTATPGCEVRVHGG